MRGVRFVPLGVVTATVVAAGGAAVARQEPHPALASSSSRVTIPLGETVSIVLVAAVATLPLVTLLMFLRRRPLPGRRLTLNLSGRRHYLFGLGALLLALPGALLLLGALVLGGSARSIATVVIPLVAGFAIYSVVLNRLVRWLDQRLPAKWPAG